MSKPLTNIYKEFTALPKPLRLTTLILTTTLTLFTANFVYGYRRWKALGAGGLPYNLKGYFMNLMIELFYARADTTGLGVYDVSERWWRVLEGAEEGGVAKKRFLKEELKEREGGRARAKRFAIPQRERNANDPVDEKIRETYLSAFNELATSNPSTTEWRTSLLEKRGKALFLQPNMTLRNLDQQTQREICHVHASDLSGHVTLALADAKEVVAKGWGERHRLSGTKFLPLGYTLMYVPRTVEEVEVYMRIFQAGVDYLASAE